MPRKYDKTIRFYASWFGDLQDPEKEFTDAEKWQIVLTIARCQMQCSIEPLQSLPLTIRRALSMETLREQIIRQIERSEKRAQVSSRGGQTTAARRRSEVLPLAESLKMELTDIERAERAMAEASQPSGPESMAAYKQQLIKGAQGDAATLQQLGVDMEWCKTKCKEWSLKY